MYTLSNDTFDLSRIFSPGTGRLPEGQRTGARSCGPRGG